MSPPSLDDLDAEVHAYILSMLPLNEPSTKDMPAAASHELVPELCTPGSEELEVAFLLSSDDASAKDEPAGFRQVTLTPELYVPRVSSLYMFEREEIAYLASSDNLSAKDEPCTDNHTEITPVLLAANTDKYGIEGDVCELPGGVLDALLCDPDDSTTRPPPPARRRLLHS